MSDEKIEKLEKQIQQKKRQVEKILKRDREKERRARTKRLIETGAVLEKLVPIVKTMNKGTLEKFLNLIIDFEEVDQYENYAIQKLEELKKDKPC